MRRGPWRPFPDVFESLYLPEGDITGGRLQSGQRLKSPMRDHTFCLSQNLDRCDDDDS
jgi:hypothetical protein